MSLTHDWWANTDGASWFIYGGQPDDNGRHPYTLRLVDCDGEPGDAAEQIAAALRGEA